MRFTFFLLTSIIFISCSVFSGKSSKKPKGDLVLINTNYGNMKVVLYDQTPLHKANFLKLVDSSFYDSVLFHRVIKDFMIQAGDPNSKNASKDQNLGNGGPGYKIPAEIRPGIIHKKGALSAAREGNEVNPEKESSGSQFYIVQGRTYAKSDLKNMSESMDNNTKMRRFKELIFLPENAEKLKRIRYCQAARLDFEYDSIVRSFEPETQKYLDSIGPHSFTELQLQTYSSIGGTPHLDGGYTVFGEVVEGVEVIDVIASVKTNGADRPVEDVRILSMKRVKR